MFCLDLTETEMTIVIVGAAVLLLAIILGIVVVHQYLRKAIKERCADLEKGLATKLQENSSISVRCADVEKRLDDELQEKNDLLVRCADMEKRLDAELQEKNDLVSKCADVEKRLDAELQEKNDLVSRCTDVEKRMEAELLEKNELSVRVSELISSRVNENKSDITDLNDEFRSEKLGEMSAELYDNEWTDAFDELTEKVYSNTEAIQRLLDIVMTTYYLCRNSAEEKWMIVLSWITNVGQDNIRQVLQHGRKAEAVRNMHSYQSKIADTLTNNCRDEMLQPLMSAPGPVRLYLEACIELCLLMVFHDPPLVWKCPLWVPATFSGQKVPVSNEPPTTETNLNNKVADNPIVMTEERHQLNKQIFKTYMNAGTWIEFIVWPALMHQNNKQIVRKGVAQGRE